MDLKDVGAWTGLVLLRLGTGGEAFKSDNEPSGSKSCGEFLEQLRIC